MSVIPALTSPNAGGVIIDGEWHAAEWVTGGGGLLRSEVGPVECKYNFQDGFTRGSGGCERLSSSWKVELIPNCVSGNAELVKHGPAHQIKYHVLTHLVLSHVVLVRDPPDARGMNTKNAQTAATPKICNVTVDLKVDVQRSKTTEGRMAKYSTELGRAGRMQRR
jgi:hypothetical protein